jgi:mannosyltransferase
MFKSLVRENFTEALLSAILIVGVIVTVFLNIKVLALQSIRLDESQSLWFASKPVIDILRATATDVHVPLYNVLLHFWLLLTGNSVQGARAFSLLFFILTIPFYFLLSKETANIRVALLAVILFVLSPFVLWFSSEARMYTLFVFITTVNNLFFLRRMRSGGAHGSTGYWITTVVGLYTHYFYNFVVITQLAYLALHFYKSKHKREFIPWIKLIGSAYLTFIPWVLFFVSSGGGSQTSPLIPRPSSYNIIQSFINFLFGFQTNAVQSVLVALWPISLFLLFIAFTSKRILVGKNIYYFLMLLFLPILLAFAASIFKPIFLTRYFIFVTPALFLLLALILVNVSGKILNFITIPVIGVMFLFMLFQNLSSMTPVKEDFEGVSTYLKETASTQDIVAITPPFTVYPIEYSYRGSAKLDTIPEWNRFQSGGIPAFSIDTLKLQMDGYKQVYQNVYIVFSYDQGYEREVRDYMDQNYELVDSKEFGPNVTLRVYKLRYN